MFDTSNLLTYILAALVLIVIPGPAVLYIVARALEQGRLAGLASVLGIGVGALVHTAAVALGVSAILATSAVAFNVVKYLGAAYLIYLGLSTLLKKNSYPETVVVEPQPLRRIFGQGVVVNLLNPKTALFFLAFLPQFADPTRGSLTVQLLLLGLIFVLIALLSDGVYALLAGQMGEWLRRRPAIHVWQRRFSGVIYLGLGLTAALSGGRNR
jgi:threonine/homoserine/homoserine lactone efflux protein